MAADERKQIQIWCDADTLKAFKRKLLDESGTMQSAVERWIAEYVCGQRSLSDPPLPSEGKCPVCESTLKVTPKGMALVQIGPLEPMTPGEIPAVLMGLVRNFVEAYSDDQVFRDLITGIMVLRTRK